MPRFGSHATDENGYTRSLFVGEHNILTKWGIEFNDGDCIFIQDQKHHATYTINELIRTNDKTYADIRVKLSQSDVHVKLYESFSRSKVTREYILTPQQDTYFMDISISQAFKQKFFTSAEMNEKKMYFDGVERNHQFITNYTLLRGKEFDLRITFESNNVQDEFIKTIYMRPSPKYGWVIHSRLLAQNAVKKAIMWCNPSWNKRIPGSDFFSLFRPLVDYLWYVGENPQMVSRKTLGFASFGLGKMPAGKEIILREIITIHPPTG